LYTGTRGTAIEQDAAGNIPVVVVGRIIKENITPKSKIGASSLGFKYIVYRLPA
jgi:hypothetical protein